MNLRFEFRVLNENGECIVSDFTTIDPTWIGEFGDCEPVDIHTGSALRAVRRDHLAGRLSPEMVEE
jgi:hypothetical protein